MALEHAILVSLAERSATGYDLARRFDASIAHFWPASHQQIYKVLPRMQMAGLVSVQVVEQDGRPDKKVYEITDAGRMALADWLATAPAPEHLRSDFTVRLRAQHLGDRSRFIEIVRERRAEHERALAAYEDNMARHFPDPARLTDAELGSYLALRGGIRLERNGIDWCNEILDKLEER